MAGGEGDGVRRFHIDFDAVGPRGRGFLRRDPGVLWNAVKTVCGILGVPAFFLASYVSFAVSVDTARARMSEPEVRVVARAAVNKATENGLSRAVLDEILRSQFGVRLAA